MDKNSVFLPPSLGDMLKLAQHDSTLAACISMWREGKMSYEDALETCICAMITEKDSLYSNLEELMNNSTRPYVSPYPISM